MLSEFRSAPAVPVRGGAASTLFLIGLERGSIRVASRMSDAESSTVAGRAAWRRQNRLAWYLWKALAAAPSASPTLLVAQLDDISDEPVLGVPKFSSNGGGGEGWEQCGHKIPGANRAKPRICTAAARPVQRRT